MLWLLDHDHDFCRNDHEFVCLCYLEIREGFFGYQICITFLPCCVAWNQCVFLRDGVCPVNHVRHLSGRGQRSVA